MESRRPIFEVRPPLLPDELISILLTSQPQATNDPATWSTLIICQTREAFTRTLQDYLNRPLSPPPPESESSNGPTLSPAPPPHSPRHHDPPDLLSPESGASQRDQPPEQHPLTLPQTPFQRLAARSVRVLFVPTPTHLRACLAALPAPVPAAPAPPSALLVYGFLALHRDTSEWSAQGISTTAAGLVRWASSVGDDGGGGGGGAHVVRASVSLVEGLSPPVEDASGEGLMGASEAVAMARTRKEALALLLDERVPILGAQARRLVGGAAGKDGNDDGDGDGDEGQAGGPGLKRRARWFQRTVSVGSVLARWFVFRPEALDGKPVAGEPPLS